MSATILVVDDDPLIQLTISGILEDEGYTVISAGDGLEALAKLAGLRPVAILLDLTMPHLSGQTLLEQITINYPTVHTIVMTATHDLETVVQCM